MTTSKILNAITSVKTKISGRMLTFRYLAKALKFCREVVVITSCVPNKDMSNIVVNAPIPTPVALVNVTIVVTVVVVTVDIMADKQALFRCQDAYKVY